METNQVQEISKLALASVKVGQSDFPIAILPNNMNISSLEDFNQHRNYFRAKYNTDNFGSFISYAKRNEKTDAQCFINSEVLGAEIIFDIGTPEKPLHGKHTANLVMSKTAAYKALLEFQGRKLNQRDFSEWLEDWADYLTAYNGDDEKMSLTATIQAIRKMTLDYARSEEHNISDFGASKSALESVEAKSKLELPKGFLFVTEPYQGLSAQGFYLRLSVLTGGDAPILVARLTKLEKIQEAIAQEFADKLIEQLKDTDINVNIGVIKL